MYNFKILVNYLKLYNRAQMVNKASYILEFFISFVTVGINFFLFWVMLNKIGMIEDWSVNESSFYYAVSLFLFNITSAIFGLALYYFDNIIIKGDLDKLLIKPGSLLIHLISQNIHFFLFASSVASFSLVIYTFININLEINIIKLIYFTFSSICGLLLYGAIYIFFMSFSFKHNKTSGLRNMMFNVRKFTEFPLLIFPKVFQYILTFLLPLAFVTYYPCLLLFGKYMSNIDLVFCILSPFICILLFTLSKKFFYNNLNKYYTSAGN